MWALNAAEGTAVGPTVPVTADGTVCAIVTAIWSDVDGVRLSIDWQRSPDDMSAAEALALADVLRSLASIDAPL